MLADSTLFHANALSLRPAPDAKRVGPHPLLAKSPSISSVSTHLSTDAAPAPLPENEQPPSKAPAQEGRRRKRTHKRSRKCPPATADKENVLVYLPKSAGHPSSTQGKSNSNLATPSKKGCALDSAHPRSARKEEPAAAQHYVARSAKHEPSSDEKNMYD